MELPPGDDPDGSAELLGILAGEPRQYVDFARDYFERDVALSDVATVYRHEPLTEELVQRLKPGANRDALAKDMEEIGYPERD